MFAGGEPLLQSGDSIGRRGLRVEQRLFFEKVLGHRALRPEKQNRQHDEREDTSHADRQVAPHRHPLPRSLSYDADPDDA